MISVFKGTGDSEIHQVVSAEDVAPQWVNQEKERTGIV